MSRNALRWWEESVSPHRARNSCSYRRKTSATSSRGSINVVDHHPRSDRWASVGAHQTDCESLAVAAATTFRYRAVVRISALSPAQRKALSRRVGEGYEEAY